MTHQASFRIYYEDTDAGGVVYYANYLRFAERARTEWLRAIGFDQSQLRAEHKIMIVVRRCTADYLSPARLDDKIVIETHLKALSKVRMTVWQAINRDGKQLAVLEVQLACVGEDGKPCLWPEMLFTALEKETTAQSA